MSHALRLRNQLWRLGGGSNGGTVHVADFASTSAKSARIARLAVLAIGMPHGASRREVYGLAAMACDKIKRCSMRRAGFLPAFPGLVSMRIPVQREAGESIRKGEVVACPIRLWIHCGPNSAW